MNIQGSAQHIDIMNIITEKVSKEMKESRTKPKHHRMENYDILTNGFFLLFCRFRLYIHQQSSLFSLIRLLFVPFEETHIAPWRLLLLRSFVVLLPAFENSNGFFQLPKKKKRKIVKKSKKKSFRGSLSSFNDCCGTQLLD